MLYCNKIFYYYCDVKIWNFIIIIFICIIIDYIIDFYNKL